MWTVATTTVKSIGVVALLVTGMGCHQETHHDDAYYDSLAHVYADAAPKPITYNKADYGKDWPLRIPRITVHCEDGVALIGLGSDGELYAIKGAARPYMRNKGISVRPISDVQIVGKDNGIFKNTCH